MKTALFVLSLLMPFGLFASSNCFADEIDDLIIAIQGDAQPIDLHPYVKEQNQL